MSKELGAELARKLNVSKEEQLAGFLNSILQGRGETAAEMPRLPYSFPQNRPAPLPGRPSTWTEARFFIRDASRCSSHADRGGPQRPQALR
jgi:hypothetical protein